MAPKHHLTIIATFAQEPTNQHIEAETNGRHFPNDIFKCIFMN